LRNGLIDLGRLGAAGINRHIKLQANASQHNVIASLPRKAADCLAVFAIAGDQIQRRLMSCLLLANLIGSYLMRMHRRQYIVIAGRYTANTALSFSVLKSASSASVRINVGVI